jgi:hypothetical protein
MNLPTLSCRSGTGSSATQELPITKPYQPRVLFSEELRNPQPGDILLVTGEAQSWLHHAYNTMLAGQLILAESGTAIAGTEITERNGYNITPATYSRRSVNTK